MDEKDAVIFAPPATLFLGGNGNLALPTPEELLIVYESERKRLEQELQELKITCSTIANVAISLAQMRRDDTGKDVVIPREMVDRMEGAQIALREDKDRNVIVMHRERGVFPVEGED